MRKRQRGDGELLEEFGVMLRDLSDSRAQGLDVSTLVYYSDSVYAGL